MIKERIEHPGFLLINTASPCITFNKVNTNTWFKERLVDLEADGYDPTDPAAALAAVSRRDGKIPHGLIYKGERLSLHEKVLPEMARPAREDPEATLGDRRGGLERLMAWFWGDDAILWSVFKCLLFSHCTSQVHSVGWTVVLKKMKDSITKACKPIAQVALHESGVTLSQRPETDSIGEPHRI